MRKAQRNVLSIFMVTLFVIPVFLLAQETTGTLRGVVIDEGKEALPGVTVEIESPNLMGTRSTITDTRGFYRFLYLPPGIYKICAKLEGFGTCWEEGVAVHVGKTSTVDIKMRQAGLEETITITAEAPVIDTERSDKSYHIPLKVLTDVPIRATNDFRMAWFTTPGVTGETSHRRQRVNAGNVDIEPGHNARDTSENMVTMDGGSIVDPFTGLVFAELNNEVFQEIEMKTAGAPAEYGQARQAFMNIITKSGGNQFHGSFLFEWKPESFAWTNVEGGRTSRTTYYNPSLTVSGPILKDRLWFLASGRYQIQNYQHPDTIVVDKLIRETRGFMPHVKLTFQPHPNHTLTVGYQNDKQVIDKDTWSGLWPSAKYATEEVMGRKEYGGPFANFGWRWIISNDLIFNFNASYLHKPINEYSRTRGPQKGYYDQYLGNVERVEGGGPFDYFSVRNTLPISLNLTWYQDNLWNTGSHEFKVGAQIGLPLRSDQGHTYLEDQYGYYRYYYALDYEEYGLTEPYIWQAQDVSPGSGYMGYYWGRNIGVFFQDVWSITKNLSLSMGLRWDNAKSWTEGRDQLPALMEEIYSGIRSNVGFDNSGFSPRFGLTYNWEKVGVFKFHVGRYLEQVGSTDGCISPASVVGNTYRMAVANFGKGPESLDLYVGGVYKPTANHYVDLDYEYNDEFIASFERELFWHIVFNTSFIYRKSHVYHGFDMNPVFEEGKFVDYRFPDYYAIWRYQFFKGDEERTNYDYRGLQFDLRRNFTDRIGFLINFSRDWRAYNRLKFDATGTDQFIYAQPSDITRKNDGVLWVFHGTIYYRFPGDLTISTFISGQSGRWVNDLTGDYGLYEAAPRVIISNGKAVPDILWQARNSYYKGKVYGEYGRRTDSIWTINARFEKGVNISRTRLTVAVNFYNIFNWASYDSFESADIRNPRYGNKLSPQEPRAAQINIRLEF